MSGIKRLCSNCFSVKKGGVCPVCGCSRGGAERDGDALPRGTRLAKKYILGGVIGRGGFGITYLAYDVKGSKTVVIKEYFPTMLARRERLKVLPTGGKSAVGFNHGAERFYDEAEMVSRFNGNSSVVSVFECLYENNTAYFAMEYLDGITLENRVKRFGPLGREETLYVAEKLTMALVVLHSGRVLHRDVAPDNIMLCRDGRVKLIDFGAARQLVPDGSLGHTVMIKSGFTPTEQYASQGGSDERSDIYSLGASLYYAMTGKIPPDPYRRTENGLSDADTDDAFTRVILRAFAVEPSERYESAERLMRELNGLGQESRPPAFPDGYNALSENSASAAVKRPRLVPAAAVCGAAVCAALVLPFALGNGAPKISPVPPDETANARGEVSDSSRETSAAPAALFDPPRETAEAALHTAPDYFTWSELVDTPETGEPVELRLDSEYKGDFEPAGHISSEYLKGFGGAVKVTVGFERWEGAAPNNIQGLIPVDADGNCVLEYLTASANSWADDNGYINLDPNMTSYSFVISERGVDSLGSGGLFFEGYNVILTSARLAGSREMLPFSIRSFADSDLPLVELSDGSRFVEFNEYKATDWGGVQTGSISQREFDAIEGDVKVTITVEHLPQAYDYWHTVYVRNSGYCFNVFDDDFLVPQLRDGGGEPLIQRGGGYAIVPDASLSECVFIIPERVKPKMSGGVFFQSFNVAVRSAKLEPYSGEYDEFVEWEEEI